MDRSNPRSWRRPRARPRSIALRPAAVSSVVLRAHAENGWLELREAPPPQDATVTVTGRAPLSWYVVRGRRAGRCRDSRAGDQLTAAILAPFVDPASGAARRLGGCHARRRERHAESLGPYRRAEARSPRRPHRRSSSRPRIPTRIVARDASRESKRGIGWTGHDAEHPRPGSAGRPSGGDSANGLVDLRMRRRLSRCRDDDSGAAGTRLSITGTLDDPRVDGDMTLTAGELRLADPR